MEENKNINPEIEAEESFDTAEAEAVKADKKEKKVKVKKPKKEKLLKNQALFKKGGYSIAITAIVLAGIIVFNVLVSALTERFVLEFDMTADKENSISAENIEYIRDIETDVSVIVCAAEETYTEYVGSVAQQYYGVTYDSSVAEYYAQTVNLIKKYNSYNDKIKIEFIDPQSNEFATVVARFGSDNLAYGDVIVSREKEDGTLRFKKINYQDIYVLNQDQTYAAMGMSMASVSGNNIETALTGAISYVLSDTQKKVAMFTGHSPADYTASYKKTLENNNFLVETVSSPLIDKVSSDYDVIVIPGPTKDFVESEISAIAEFLDNDGKLGKGMIVFADATAPYLTNFYDFLSDWGITIEDGILFETNETIHAADDPTTFISQNTDKDKNLSDLAICATGSNIPMKVAFENQAYMAVSSLVETSGTTVAAPKGSTASWTGASEMEPDTYSLLIESIKSNYDADNNEIETRVSVFGSVEFLDSQYTESANYSNKEFTFAMAERAAGVDDTGISFISKSITNNSFIQSVSQASASAIRNIFMFIVPIAVIVVGVYIYIKRRNAE